MKKKKLGIDIFKLKKRKMIPFTKRNLSQEFNLGDEIFISFDGKTAERGFVKIIHNNEHLTILLHNGNTHYLYFDEVHYTPEMAVKYQVTT